MKTFNEIFIQTLDSMPYEFTGQEFSKKAQRNGIPQGRIVNGENTAFLHANAERIGYKSWRKRVNGTDIEHDEQKMISFLKSKGYKIMKLIKEYREV